MYGYIVELKIFACYCTDPVQKKSTSMDIVGS